MPARYAFLRFRDGVDWKDVDPTLLARVNRLGMYLHKVITIVSGARTPEGNTGASHSHHVPQNNPSGMGEAVDAYIGSKALASAVKEPTLKRFGLYSGNRPGFYQGKPDPEHIETLERRGFKYKGPDAQPAQEQTSAQPAGAADTSQQGITPNLTQAELPGPPSPEETLAPILNPGTVGADDLNPKRLAQTWQQLASQPLASQETQYLAQSASMTGG